MAAISVAGSLPFDPRKGPPLGPITPPGPGLIEAVAGGLLAAAKARRAAAPGASTIGRGAADPTSAASSMPLVDRSDEALMTAYLSGDRAAFVELVERYRTELHTFLARFLGSAAAADDVFQETFLQVHLSGHTFDQQRNFKPWLFTIAANKARDWHRRQKRRKAASLDAPIGHDPDGARLVDLIEGESIAPGAPIEAAEVRQQVKDVVDALPAHYREILLLNYFQRMSYGQIADALGIPLGTVKSRLHAAVAAFAERWRLAAGRAPGAGKDGMPGSKESRR
jgi:RNA polymerase sigma-70 factor (ECF subfamily)